MPKVGAFCQFGQGQGPDNTLPEQLQAVGIERCWIVPCSRSLPLQQIESYHADSWDQQPFCRLALMP